MKHLFISLFCLLFLQNVFAQRPYQPMVVEGATWVYASFFDASYCYNGLRPIPNKFFNIQWIDGDTLINGTEY
ncbi:MAG: hypothetical protein R3B47_05020 [Bacteroidia bacterium]